MSTRHSTPPPVTTHATPPPVTPHATPPPVTGPPGSSPNGEDPARHRVSALVVMADLAPLEAVDQVVALVEKRGLEVTRVGDGPPVVLSVRGDVAMLDAQLLATVPGVAQVVGPSPLFPLVGRTANHPPTQVRIGRALIGGDCIEVIAGPCAVSSASQVDEVAARLGSLGVRLIRAGAFKPRTSPYAFQGAGLDGLDLLRQAALRHGLAVVTEVMEPALVDSIAARADMLQVGARNMSNYPLLRAVGRCNRPVLLKRSLSASYSELMGAAEYILKEGNPNVVLCERGIRTFIGEVRETLDISAVPVLKRKTHLPVVVDPSHAAGSRDLVAPLALAALAAGADGIMIEVDRDPEAAPSDGAQSLWLDQLEALLVRCRTLSHALGRRFLE